MSISMYMRCMKFRDEIFVRWVDCDDPSRRILNINGEMTELPLRGI